MSDHGPHDEEEAYPLVNATDPEGNTSSILPPPIPGYSRTRRRTGISGVFHRIRAKIHSTRPVVRILVLFTILAFPIYRLSLYAGGESNRGHWDDELEIEPRPTPGKGQEQDGSKVNPKPVPESDPIWEKRAQEVKAAFVHAYSSYEKYAFPSDELLPLSKGKVNNFNGWGVSAVDTMDTMYMMGLSDELKRARDFVAGFDYKGQKSHVQFFETSIRYFGGLLAAYAMTQDPILLVKADELGTALMPVFNTPSGYPKFAVRPSDGDSTAYWGPDSTILADLGSCQLEYKYLAHLTGKRVFFDKVEKIRQGIGKHIDSQTGLLAIFWNFNNGNPIGQHFSIGALADSGYEYLLKQYLLSGKKEVRALEMYMKTTQGIIENLLYISPKRHLMYATDIDNGRPSHTFEHLSCFLPGLFALGAHTLDLTRETKQLHLYVAEGLAQTCYLGYRDMPSGLGPEEMQFPADGAKKWYPLYKEWISVYSRGVPPGVFRELRPEQDRDKREYLNGKNSYLLRPETIESLFIMWKVTGNVVWRTRGYEIFEGIERSTKTEIGYASVDNVDSDKPNKKDSMPSYFLAETLKYLWLLFKDDEHHYDLEKVVYNTEAHPLPVFTWSEAEIKDFAIPVQK